MLTTINIEKNMKKFILLGVLSVLFCSASGHATRLKKVMRGPGIFEVIVLQEQETPTEEDILPCVETMEAELIGKGYDTQWQVVQVPDSLVMTAVNPESGNEERVAWYVRECVSGRTADWARQIIERSPRYIDPPDVVAFREIFDSYESKPVDTIYLAKRKERELRAKGYNIQWSVGDSYNRMGLGGYHHASGEHVLYTWSYEELEEDIHTMLDMIWGKEEAPADADPKLEAMLADTKAREAELIEKGYETQWRVMQFPSSVVMSAVNQAGNEERATWYVRGYWPTTGEWPMNGMYPACGDANEVLQSILAEKESEEPPEVAGLREAFEVEALTAVELPELAQRKDAQLGKGYNIQWHVEAGHEELMLGGYNVASGDCVLQGLLFEQDPHEMLEMIRAKKEAAAASVTLRAAPPADADETTGGAE